MRDEGVKSADRVLDLFELLTSAPDGLSFSHIASRLTWPKSSTHALLRTMERRGYLSRNDATRTFQIGIRLWEAGQAYRLHADLALHALPAMQRVVDDIHETVQLAVRDGRDNVYLAKVDSQQPMQLVSRIGSRIPSHGTGLGKVLLADLTDRELDALYVDATLVRFTPNTITDLARLKEVVNEVRRVGHAVDEEEFAIGLRCIAVPILGVQRRTMAALSCSIPSARLDAAKAQRTLTLLKQAAAEISRRMGAGLTPPAA
ncbi:MAG: IclR family transcriptional regulator [Chloroflexota bacterium]|nr:IclR family transcriptional regulator [Chloroflexota bacterium]